MLLASNQQRISTTVEARDLLASPDWPRGPAHEAAYATCLKVLDGNRSTVDARDRFVEAARAASLLEI
jgi:hypothetical protein